MSVHVVLAWLLGTAGQQCWRRLGPRAVAVVCRDTMLGITDILGALFCAAMFLGECAELYIWCSHLWQADDDIASHTHPHTARARVPHTQAAHNR